MLLFHTCVVEDCEAAGILQDDKLLFESRMGTQGRLDVKYDKGICFLLI